jgi:hypothetical protein
MYFSILTYGQHQFFLPDKGLEEGRSFSHEKIVIASGIIYGGED